MKTKRLFSIGLLGMLFLPGIANAQVSTGKLYRFISRCGDETKVMAIENSSTSNSARAVLASRNNSSLAQVFKIDAYSGAYRITAQHSGRALDVKAGSTANGAPIIQYDFTGGPNQLFKVQSTTNGYQILNVNSLRYITLQGSTAADGQPFIQYERLRNCAQFFRLEEAKPISASGRNAFSTIQAESMNASQGGATDSATTGMQGVVGALNNSNYLRYNQVNFGDGALSVSVSLGVASGFEGKRIEFRVDSVTGPVIGNLDTQSTGGWQTIKAQSANINKTTGLHDLYLVMVGNAVGNLDSFIFSNTTVKAPAPAPAPTPAPTPSGSLTIDQVISNQNASAHEATPIDPQFEWMYKPGIIQQSPAGADIPSWFPYSKPQWCRTINSWMQAFEAQGNAASNTRVQYKNMRVFVLSNSTRKWTQIDISSAPYTDTWKYPFTFASSGGTRNESSGGVSHKPKYPNFPHGYGNSRSLPDAADVRAVYVAIETRLVVDNASGTDDRSKAKYLLNLGADFWGASDWTYAPGVGQGRMILVKPEWRTATMLVPNKRIGASFEEMRSNPPPLNVP